MYKNLKWKLLVIAAVAAIGIFAFTPPSRKVKLGLDLKGGIHLVLKVNTEDAVELETEPHLRAGRGECKDADGRDRGNHQQFPFEVLVHALDVP